jgi:[ribosomal protein S5]-alanine N-acetyltransferase
MAFLRSSLLQEVEPEIRGRGLWLRPPAMVDYPAWFELRAGSRDQLTPFEPAWAHDELSRSAYRRRLRHYGRDLREDLGYAFFIFRESDDVLIGGLTLSNVRRGVSQTAAVGYWVGAGFSGQGLMTDALRIAIPFAFEGLRLHRLEAACLPHNAASIRVLAKNGFQAEGRARRYLKINGNWQDHLLFALNEDDARREVLS